MRYRTIHATLIASCVLMTAARAQQKQNIAYAITSPEKGNFNWTDVKQIDFSTGTVTRSIFDSKQVNVTAYSARTGKVLQLPIAATTPNNAAAPAASPVAALSAACAYDIQHNRLYYAPMFLNQLRYIDLNESTPKIYYFESEQLTPATDLNNEANHITRMVIAADGNGYALSNDANHLIRFTTGRSPIITDLGTLQDDAQNGDQLSVHNKTTAWGGDMIADAAGNLYVVSAFHHIFRVNITSRLATHIAEIQGLPANFTTNGAVVDANGNLLVSSANVTDGYYQVDMHTWQATKLAIQGAVFNASDLANGNLAFANDKTTIPLLNRPGVLNKNIALYPNPVSTSQLHLSFNNQETGKYTIQLVDLNGKIISAQEIELVSGSQVVPVTLYNSLAKGPYMVKVLNYTKKAVFTDKLIVE